MVLTLNRYLVTLLQGIGIQLNCTGVVTVVCYLAEDYVGDSCESDQDADGVADKYDDCISNPFITTTDLSSYTIVSLYPESSAAETAWLILHEGKEARQLIQTDMPAILVGEFMHHFWYVQKYTAEILVYHIKF